MACDGASRAGDRPGLGGISVAPLPLPSVPAMVCPSPRGWGSHRTMCLPPGARETYRELEDESPRTPYRKSGRHVCQDLSVSLGVVAGDNPPPSFQLGHLRVSEAEIQETFPRHLCQTCKQEALPQAWRGAWSTQVIRPLVSHHKQTVHAENKSLVRRLQDLARDSDRKI